MADRPENFALDATLRSAAAAIDACRPGSEDLQRELPADVSAEIRCRDVLAARYRDVQRFDHAVASAFAAVPIPSGLADRLFAALAEQQAEAEAAKLESSRAEADKLSTASVVAPAPLESIPSGDSIRTSRRRWLQICGGALASTAAGAGFLWWRRSSDQPDLSLEEMLNQALAFNESAEARLGEAVPVTREPAPTDYPKSWRLVGLRDVVRWRRLDGRFLGREGVAYELGPTDRSATLYVLAAEGRRGSAAIPSLPEEPLNPITTGGFTQAGWREEGRIQILIVAGDADRFRSFLTRPGEIA